VPLKKAKKWVRKGVTVAEVFSEIAAECPSMKFDELIELIIK